MTADTTRAVQPVPAAPAAALDAEAQAFRSDALTPLQLLRQLDGWLCNTGHDDGHPWRLSIGATLAHAEDETHREAEAAERVAAAHLTVAEIEAFSRQAEQVQALLVVLGEYAPGVARHPDEVRRVIALHDLAEGTATWLRDGLIAAAERASQGTSGVQGGAA